MGGKACIRGRRITVGVVVRQIGGRHSFDDVLADYPYLARGYIGLRMKLLVDMNLSHAGLECWMALVI